MELKSGSIWRCCDKFLLALAASNISIYPQPFSWERITWFQHGYKRMNISLSMPVIPQHVQ